MCPYSALGVFSERARLEAVDVPQPALGHDRRHVAGRRASTAAIVPSAA